MERLRHVRKFFVWQVFIQELSLSAQAFLHVHTIPRLAAHTGLTAQSDERGPKFLGLVPWPPGRFSDIKANYTTEGA